MRQPLYLLPLLLSILLLASGCGSRKSVVEKAAERAYSADYEAPRKEVRAVWFPTVFRSQYGRMTVGELQTDLRRKVDELAKLGVNVIYFQVRPEADAWYYSPYEPWSRFLTGEQGRAPEPLWDPLAFMIKICHERSIELHAWINPYRAVADISSYVAPGHPSKQHPEWFVRYGKQLLFNPGLPEVRAYTCKVVRDLVTRYDLDGIHMDDYFYPYPIAGEAFDDEAAYRLYGQAFASKDDWRRNNVTQLIRDLSQTIRSVKPYVQLGISPFGIYRNERTHPVGSKTGGLQNYDDLYADILLWDQEGLMDYVVPQIYWNMGHKVADYTELVLWWSRHIKNAQLIVGQHVRRTMDGDQLHPKMVLAAKHTSGNSIWPGDDLWGNSYKGIAEQLHKDYWSVPALVPARPYPASMEPFPEPERDAAILTGSGRQELVWMDDLPLPPGQQTAYYVIYCHPRRAKIQKALDPENIVGRTHECRFRPLDLGGKFKVAFTITRIDRFGHEHVVAREVHAVL